MQIELSNNQFGAIEKAFTFLNSFLDTDLSQYMLLNAPTNRGQIIEMQAEDIIKLFDHIASDRKLLNNYKDLFPAFYAQFLNACTVIDQNLIMPAIKQVNAMVEASQKAG